MFFTIQSIIKEIKEQYGNNTPVSPSTFFAMMKNHKSSFSMPEQYTQQIDVYYTNKSLEDIYNMYIEHKRNSYKLRDLNRKPLKKRKKKDNPFRNE